jgi:copper(I)-binding protein
VSQTVSVRVILTIAAAFILAGLASGSAVAHEFKVGDLRIDHPWSRAVATKAATAAGYMAIHNIGKEPDRLIGASTPRARTVEIHEMTMIDNVMRMRPVAGGIEIRPGEAVRIAPNGLHLMIVGPDDGFVQGARIPMTLEFARAGKVDVELAVESARARAADHAGH